MLDSPLQLADMCGTSSEGIPRLDDGGDGIGDGAVSQHDDDSSGTCTQAGALEVFVSERPCDLEEQARLNSSAESAVITAAVSADGSPAAILSARLSVTPLANVQEPSGYGAFDSIARRSIVELASRLAAVEERLLVATSFKDVAVETEIPEPQERRLSQNRRPAALSIERAQQLSAEELTVHRDEIDNPPLPNEFVPALHTQSFETWRADIIEHVGTVMADFCTKLRADVETSVRELKLAHVSSAGFGPRIFTLEEEVQRLFSTVNSIAEAQSSIENTSSTVAPQKDSVNLAEVGIGSTHARLGSPYCHSEQPAKNEASPLFEHFAAKLSSAVAAYAAYIGEENSTGYSTQGVQRGTRSPRREAGVKRSQSVPAAVSAGERRADVVFSVQRNHGHPQDHQQHHDQSMPRIAVASPPHPLPGNEHSGHLRCRTPAVPTSQVDPVSVALSSPPHPVCLDNVPAPSHESSSMVGFVPQRQIPSVSFRPRGRPPPQMVLPNFPVRPSASLRTRSQESPTGELRFPQTGSSTCIADSRTAIPTPFRSAPGAVPPLLRVGSPAPTAAASARGLSPAPPGMSTAHTVRVAGPSRRQAGPLSGRVESGGAVGAATPLAAACGAVGVGPGSPVPWPMD